MTDHKLADEIERALNVLQPLAHGDILFSAPNAAPGCELRFSSLREAVAALRRSEVGPLCEDCGFKLARGELDRSGQEWWCPVCTKAGMRMAENKRLRKELAERQPSSDQVLGLRVVVNPDVPADEVWIRDANGKQLGRIINLAAEAEGMKT